MSILNGFDAVHQPVIKSDVDLLISSNLDGYIDPAFSDAVEVAALKAVLLPPSNNMGVTPPLTPLFLPQCEITNNKNKVLIDWLGFSSLFSIDEILYSLRQIWPDLLFSKSSVGMVGYPECKAIMNGNVQFGLVGFGSKTHERISVVLTGVACKTITFDDQFAFLHDVLVLLDARLSRVDLALDFYRGEITFDAALWAHGQGHFKKNNAPKNPEHKVVCGVGADGQNLGRTLYIGSRNSELFARIYEKGLEVFARMPEEYRQLSTERENLKLKDSGAVRSIADDWLRLEVEFKRKSKDRPIPLSILTDRDNFFAGAYPFFASSLKSATGRGRGSLRTVEHITHDKKIAAHKASYGNHICTLKEIGFSDTEIVNLLNSGRPDQKLMRTGLIDIQKEAYLKAARAQDPDFDIPF